MLNMLLLSGALNVFGIASKQHSISSHIGSYYVALVIVTPFSKPGLTSCIAMPDSECDG